MTDSQDLFPRSDETGRVERHTQMFGDVAAYDYDGTRYCVDCADDHPEIERERWRTEPETVPYGGAVRTHSEAIHEYHCAECGAKIPMTYVGTDD